MAHFVSSKCSFTFLSSLKITELLNLLFCGVSQALFMGISKDFKLAIIQASYTNGKSTTKRFLVYHTEWDKEAKNMDVSQISRKMNNFESLNTLTKEKILRKELKKYPYRIDSEIVLFCSVLWQMEMGTLYKEHPVLPTSLIVLSL